MSDGVCHLCFERSSQMQFNFQQNTEIQDFVEIFCQFVFNDGACTLEEICLKCWQTISSFSTFCEKIRGIHQNLIEVSCGSGLNKYEEHTEVLEDEIEEHIPMEEIDEGQIPKLEIDHLGDDGDNLIRHSGTLDQSVIKLLEEQLKFEPKLVEVTDMEFDRLARFLTMECMICAESFDSIEECNDHYLRSHGRSAYWNCCNLLLETPYEVLDHIRYHESIEVFKCAACWKCFLTSNKLKYHIRRSHLPVEGTLNCKICDKEYKNLRLLLNHQKSHIRIECPHCTKHISAANYDHHVRTAHASQISKKRKPTNKKEVANKRLSNADRTKASCSWTAGRPGERDAPARNFMISIEPNEQGMFECDICRMEFKQISLVFSHRNKVHV